MHRLSASSLALPFALTLCLGAAAAVAQTAAADAKPTAKSTKSRPATPREVVKSEAKGLALATETTESISDAQLAIASRVLTGKANCEQNQTVDVDPVVEKPGMFRVRFKETSYIMVPEETTTGAIRLLDRRTDVVWLQIPVKSMLLDNRAGHRLVDLCTQAEQRAAVEAVKAAAASVERAAPADAAAPKK